MLTGKLVALSESTQNSFKSALKKMVNRQGRIVGRRKSGCTAASQHAVTAAIKRARFMALLPYTRD